MIGKSFGRFVQKKIGKNLIMSGVEAEQATQAIVELYYQTRKRENRWSMHDVTRLMHYMHPGQQNKRYWVDTIRHHDQKKISFFVTSVLAARKVSVPLR